MTARSSRLSEYLTLREFCAAHGRPTDPTSMRRLKRRLSKRQAKSRTKFLFRLQDGPSSPYLVTEASLRQACPELFDRRAEGLDKLRVYVADLVDQLQELKQRDRALAAAIRDVRAGLAEVSARLDAAGIPRAKAGPTETTI